MNFDFSKCADYELIRVSWWFNTGFLIIIWRNYIFSQLNRCLCRSYVRDMEAQIFHSWGETHSILAGYYMVWLHGESACICVFSWTIVTVGNMYCCFYPCLPMAISHSNKFVFLKHRSDHVTALLKTLQCFPCSLRVKFNVFTMTYKALH